LISCTTESRLDSLSLNRDEIMEVGISSTKISIPIEIIFIEAELRIKLAVFFIVSCVLIVLFLQI
ncbi:MAG: hypothetical protein ABFS38_22975, partial [Bacteroidota bacterium]